ncbi:HAMP domain-containing protein [Anoxybacterium hadale]|uniref:HAMP domain-containing protein n=1 Tax=Anoxybacterium hadale TaxID=3408580 RepID=A0ACD1AEA1_9FIRM|nr:HAMP domain-containing protein [Clostridiales bacterium]
MKFTIKARLFLGFGIITIILAGMGFFSLNALSQFNKETLNIGENYLPSVDVAHTLNSTVANFRIAELRHVIAISPDEMQEMEERISTLDSTMKENITAYEALISSDAGRDLINNIRAEWQIYTNISNQITTLSSSGNSDEAMTLVRGDSKAEYDKITQMTQDLVSVNRQGAEQSVDNAAQVYSSTRMILLIVIAIAVFICIGAAFLITRSIVKPINRLITVADAMAEGDVNVSVETNLKDEIGQLMASFDRMISSIREQALAAERMAAGDLTIDIKVRSDRDLLGKKLAEMVDKNNEVLSNIAVASEQVAAGSKQVSDSSIALSQGATEQASSVEQLTASLEEISSQTKMNAQNANQANDLAETAKSNAVQGNQQMGDMLRAMEDINEASANISNIIKVIDDIAFQTNILALNAAVEAARAGQHGKGFAVVAEEVRNLAARSADAAKETTSMISSSIKKSEDGTKIARDTAGALNKIVDDIDKVATLIKEIAVASNEQATGIGQVNQGIMLVSQVVQTNSATSEESAAASEELSSQASFLREMVGKFNLKKRSSGYSRLASVDPEVLKMIESMSERKTGEAQGEEAPAAVQKEKTISLSDFEFGKY